MYSAAAETQKDKDSIANENSYGRSHLDSHLQPTNACNMSKPQAFILVKNGLNAVNFCPAKSWKFCKC